MSKRNIALVALAFLGALINSPPASAATPYLDEGCAALNAIIRQSFLDAALFNANYPGDNVGPNHAGAQSCSNTTAAVTTAFRSSLIELNIITRWSVMQSDAAFVCLSHDLRNCYPFADPMGPEPGPHDLAFVHNSWQTVRSSVLAHMPWGAGSDLSYFDTQSLANSLSASVHTPGSRRVRTIGVSR